MADLKGKSPATVEVEGTEAYDKYLQQSQESIQTALKQFNKYKSEYHALQKTLLELPGEIEHEVMVPVGPLAFFPGKLIHTNEVLVLLGDNWFVDRSAKQAAEIAERREKYVDEKIGMLKKDLEGMNARKDIMNKPTERSLISEQLPSAMYNEEGEKFIDIKEELDEGQLPEFSNTRDDAARKIQEIDPAASDVAKALAAKRARTIEYLKANTASNIDDADYAKLTPGQREILDILDQIGSEEEEKEERESESSDNTNESDEGDGFSDEDRANAARDDDDDDYNDHISSMYHDSEDHDGGTFKMSVVERRTSPLVGSSHRSNSPPKGILKPRTPILLCKLPSDASTESSKKARKSVRFNMLAEAYAQPNQELLDESNVDEDISKVTSLINVISMSPSATASSLGESAIKAPKISVIPEVSHDAEEDFDKQAISIANKANEAGVVPARKFKPNATALSGVRSKSTATASPNNESTESVTKGVVGQPMKTSVVERSPVAIEDAPTQDIVDEQMHAREIAQAYNRMRFARMSGGKLDEAAEVAERILDQVPGVTLIDKSNTGSDDEDVDGISKGYERIELPTDPSPYFSSTNNPPEVLHQKPRPKKIDPEPPVDNSSNDSKPSSNQDLPQQQPNKPKMSRFKAQRLGLSGN
ncbi:hypothetical protein GGI25_000200 [Coemansia spiralis]|uniref:DUF3835 domain-containing protein n=2 Tax=Coemansia TaxID=4863 RepID=A0A9W8G7R2_9FUNG|nr:hypothetical protein BX070DRAFT_253865 [Coemansia spiralis]KAJ1995924.1 hypothetical protein EDC05_000584 [Coemansia umbellata]KAJ2625773.1 hypothetical protein GGI26_000234 [Coemansia sp. RSA 1358]KAJ2680896.1 hypothetical protein GGI25_000200 [Coemansia spiralis]